MTYTQEYLFSQGIWNCLECGHLNSIDSHRCDQCLEDKFIMREKNVPKWVNEPFMNQLPEIVKREHQFPEYGFSSHSGLNGRRVYDKQTRITYDSIRQASDELNIPYWQLIRKLNKARNQHTRLIFA